MPDTHDASTVYHALEQDIIQDLLTELTLHYSRLNGHSGEPDKHRFALTGLSDSPELFSVLADLQAQFNPNNVTVDASTRGAFIALDFNADRITNAPPEPTRSYASPDPSDAKSRSITECTNCLQRCPNAYPPLVIKHRPEDPYKDTTTEKHRLCTHCSPGHFDDVVRNIDPFGVHDGSVERLQVEVDISNEDNHRTEWQTQWRDYTPGENPYIDDVVTIIERDLI